jgi:hypothetical protein
LEIILSPKRGKQLRPKGRLSLYVPNVPLLFPHSQDSETDASETISNNHEPAGALKMNRNLGTMGNGQNDYQCDTLFTKEFDPD